MIAVGGQKAHGKVELLSLANNWSIESDYPFGMESSNFQLYYQISLKLYDKKHT